MPGVRYTREEISAMTADEYDAAFSRNFLKPSDPADAPADRPEFAGVAVQRPQPSGDVWARRKSGDESFVCPSGQTCRLKSVSPEELMLAGIIDRISGLESLAADLVNVAEGAMPNSQQKMPSREQFAELLSTINAIVPLAVVEPKLYPDPEAGEEVVPGRIYVSDVDLEDRMAIMRKALAGIRALERFRNAG